MTTITMMAMITLLTIGLLGLSRVALKGTVQERLKAEAQANALLSIKLAMGDLQKLAGPDRAITASSEILSASPAKPHTIGVWESWWDFNPADAPDYTAEKTKRFRRWLVSSPDPTAPRSPDFASDDWTGNTIELVGKGTLGETSTGGTVAAGLVPVSRGGRVQGFTAWHVSDESVKARINLCRDPSQNTTLAEKRALLAGHRPDPSVIRSPDGTLLVGFPSDDTAAGFANARVTAGKLVHLEQAELLDQAQGRTKPLYHDLTPYSLGVLADVRRGGLKQDLTSMFELGSATANTLPIEFRGKRLYESTHGITGISDPFWSTLSGYYNSFRRLSSPDTSPTFAMTAADTTANPVPDSYNPAPVIAKVETIFSVVARPLSNMANWISNPTTAAGGTYDHMVTLIVTPVVTLHNPYNVKISFRQMRVEFMNIPVGFNFMFQDGSGGGPVSQSVDRGSFECYNTMAYREHRNPETGEPTRNNKRFVMLIANWDNDDPLKSDSTISSDIVLNPGQTIVCGPTLPPNSSFDRDTKIGHSAVGFDWEGGLLETIKARPSFVPGLGFEVSAVTISSFRNSHYSTGSLPGKPNFFPGAWRGHPFTLLRDVSTSPKTSNSATTDRFYLEYKLTRPYWYTDNTTVSPTRADPTFAVTAQIQATSMSTLQEFARLQFDYGEESTLQNAFGNRVYRYPPTGSFKATDFAAPPGVTYSSQSSYVHPFAIFSAYARTTNGGVYETGNRTPIAANSPHVNLLKDGRLAGKPFLFHNPSRSNFTMDLAREKPGVQAYEINFQPFLSKGDYEDYMDVDAANRVPSLTGNKTTTGIKSGSYLELPSGPMQTIADFRRSNALATSYLPHFVQPVSNSLLHPLMSPDRVVESNRSVTNSALLDHSVLANHALYDRFYFSTFATRGATTPDVVFEQFMNGGAPLASQAFQPYLPGDRSMADAKDRLFADGKPNETAYQIAAEYQMLRGPFNVNSTSVQAWKAVLASMGKSEVAILWARSAGLELRKSAGAPIMPMSMVNGGHLSSSAPDISKIDNQKTNAWNGYRELTEMELQRLAEKIVGEVRERGPFLSMSEFVNRQVGPAGPKTLSGALEAAIAKAEINEKLHATPADSFLNQVPIASSDLGDTKLYNYKTRDATTGNPAAGAPGWINQGDLLRILEPSATVRGDTFVIRAYGDVQDASGKTPSRAYAEAVVQRLPDYVDTADRPSLNVHSEPGASTVNKTFGRQIRMVSFRWLSNEEI